MPDKWYNWISNKISKAKFSSEKKENWVNRKILADKKPYFMKYIYPSEKTKINEYNKRNDEKCLMQFRMTLDELLHKTNKTPEEKKFIDYYYKRMPLGMAPCTINKICWRIEEIFNNVNISKCQEFDYSILKCNSEYSKDMYKKIKKIYEKYKREQQNYMQYAKNERVKSEERQIYKYMMKEDFLRQCLEQCPNEEYLCDIVLDLCYSKSKNSKQFAWDICGETFVKNLLKRNGYKISYPTLDDTGDIEFGGNHFSMHTVKLKNEEIYISEREEFLNDTE